MSFEEEFDKFLREWCGNDYAHLSDSDENDGQKLRDYVEDNYFNKQKMREAIDKHSRKGVNHYEDSWDIRPSDLKKELKLNDRT